MVPQERKNVFLDGFALAGYRSFGPELQRIAPFRKINLFVGPNNTGKSNILRFVHQHLGQLLSSGASNHLDPIEDGPRVSQPIRFVVGIADRLDGDVVAEIQKRCKSEQSHSLLRRLLESETVTARSDYVWSYRSAVNFRDQFSRWHPDIADDSIIDVYLPMMPNHEWQIIWRGLYPQHQGGEVRKWVEGVLNQIDIFHAKRLLPKAVLIPAIRRIAGGPPSDDDASGIGLIAKLAQLQHPSYLDQHLKNQFETIKAFLREVTGNPSAELEITHDQKLIQVHMDGRLLPLEALGTGIHEVIIIAATCTVLENQIICLEEPEIHLHPLLQRKLLRYLDAKTSNQYFVSTHSAHLLDLPKACIFRVELIDGFTRVSPVATSHEKWELCRDLGYRASDVVQANCVIWVEGPSDRVYLNHWLRAVDADLVEGIHYSVMFYGGRLLSHLTADDPEVTEFISLTGINRHTAVVIDSDKSGRKKTINATKMRVVGELESKGLFSWVTEGREIENYVPIDVLRRAIDAIAPGHGSKALSGRFKKVLPTLGRNRTVDKLKVAHEVASEPPALEPLDLRRRIDELAAFIRRAT